MAKEFVKNKNFKKNKKNKTFNKKQQETIAIPPHIGDGIIEYKMPRLVAENLLKDSKGKRPVQEVLCEYVNTQCNLLGYCVRVIVN